MAAGVAASDSLAELYLHHNRIGDEGGKALVAGVAASGSMVFLMLHGNSIGDAAEKSLWEAVKGRQGFQLSV